MNISSGTNLENSSVWRDDLHCTIKKKNRRFALMWAAVVVTVFSPFPHVYHTNFGTVKVQRKLSEDERWLD